jgi:hypothetical protein
MMAEKELWEQVLGQQTKHLGSKGRGCYKDTCPAHLFTSPHKVVCPGGFLRKSLSLSSVHLGSPISRKMYKNGDNIVKRQELGN